MILERRETNVTSSVISLEFGPEAFFGLYCRVVEGEEGWKPSRGPTELRRQRQVESVGHWGGGSYAQEELLRPGQGSP